MNNDKKLATKLSHLGRNPKQHEGFVNPPSQRGSTVILDSAEDLYSDKKSYGLEGTSTHDFLTDALNGIMDANGTILCPSGLSAITTTLLAFIKGGDHILITDSVYGPTRRFCSSVLKGFDVEAEYYDPRIGSDIEKLIRPNTKLIFLESPGSLTLEIQDIPAIVNIAQKHNILTAIDDTWSAGIYFKPLNVGVDISIQALTKYQGGHSDVLLGSVSVKRDDLFKKLKETHRDLGIGVAAEEAWLCLRGLKTMILRMNHQDKVARKIAAWLEKQDFVAEVIHPALPSSPDYEIWKRDFTGAGGLFSIILKDISDAQINKMLNAYELFSLGFSWGGYESLVINCAPQLATRKDPKWTNKTALIRYSIGLEDEDDLIADLERGFAAIR